jgi:hypothetical protein
VILIANTNGDFNRQHGGQWMNLLVVPAEKRNSIDFSIDKIVG